MPRSKTRKNHHDYRPPANAIKSRKNKSAVWISVFFFALVGMGIAYFAAGSTLLSLWLFAGAIVGAIGGWYFGRQIDKSFSKK